MQLKHATVLAALLAGAGASIAADQPVIGLITKTETNPFFVKMKEGAQAAAKAKGAKLLSGAGKTDGDNAGQVTAIENMIAARRQDHPDHAERLARPSCRPSRRRRKRA